MADIKLIIFDVDGTLTDGMINISDSGEIFKSFNAKDGVAITKCIKNGVIPVFVTGRESNIVNIRAKELGVHEVYQGVKIKQDIINILLKKYDCKISNIVYVGDDLNDLDVIEKCSFSACPNDAAIEIKKVVKYVSLLGAGKGAVRDIVDNYVSSLI